MTFLIRPIDGNIGSAVAIRDDFGDEKKLAVFADAGIMDCAKVGGNQCLLISRKQGIALVDLAARNVIRRGRLSIQADYIAIAYTCRPGLIATVDLTTLKQTDRYNLIQTCPDGSFQLIYRDSDALRKAGAFWDSIPYSDGPLHGEVGEDHFSLKYASEEPSGLRRMQFTRGARATFRADGKVVIPFEFSTNGPRWVHDKSFEKPLMSSAPDFRVGVAVIDVEAERLDMHVIRKQIEPSVYTSFPVRAISPDGRHAVLQGYDPIVVPEKQAKGLVGGLRSLLGCKPTLDLAFGLEAWNISREPKLAGDFPFRRLEGATLPPVTTLTFDDAELARIRREIELVFPGVEAGFAGRDEAWRASWDKRKEDAYYAPLETRKFPAYTPAFHVQFPPMFAEVAQRLARLRQNPFTTMPWDRLDDRQRAFVAGVLRVWSEQAALAADSMAWIARDRFAVLSRDGTVRECSLEGGVGQTFQLVDPETRVWPFSKRYVPSPGLAELELIHLQDRAFAVDLYEFRLEFELPSTDVSAGGDPCAPVPVAYRIVRDAEGWDREVKQVNRLAEKIRRGYVTIGSKEPARIIAGLRELAREVRDHFDEIVVDDRWLPSLHHRGSAITEPEFCDILIADGSDEAVRALDELLTAFLGAAGDPRRSIWHLDDCTPAMGPTALALIRLCDPLAPSIARYYARRDIYHDTANSEAFARVELPQSRFLSPDLVTLQIRLALQDICSRNVEADIFALYRLPLVREALRAGSPPALDLAEVIVSQLEEQTANPDLSGAARVADVLEAIASALDVGAPAEAALATELRRRAEVQHDR
ncbi:hypothetical protein M2323_003025 [Rhodoblastus acidophilus]|uniref:hypothetical protein n=1 Tax=Rhodoblastus acidophilus TaxID=1074 RepID=UPI0022252F04|nr:hypothetical protein [Rhodoblastus acidophilus]MCW2285055.1 hypothetical protein [Rhodoblastus acidophilus]MCW2334087.1 hypothetical protein [Rhodoblastus acidophilus]